MLKSLAIAVSMYSRLPVPIFDWDEKSMKYAICFFPFVGIIIGLAEFLLIWLLGLINTGNIMTVCFQAALPLLITGGIHMDGFMDTADALSSHADREKKLEILKDPHLGAFAVINFGIYMLIYTGLLTELEYLPVYCLGFVLSRALSGACVTAFPKAKNTGLAAMWSDMTDKKKALAVLLAEAAVCMLIMFVFDSVSAVLVLVFSAAILLYHYHNCMKNFGGITGDLAGYYLQLEELAVLAACVIGGRL